MADCECLGGCDFFNDRMKSKPATADLMKRRYCKSDNSDCARYMVRQSLGKTSVPADLYPNQLERARILVKA
jgi:hypothetical protein